MCVWLNFVPVLYFDANLGKGEFKGGYTCSYFESPICKN